MRFSTKRAAVAAVAVVAGIGLLGGCLWQTQPVWPTPNPQPQPEAPPPPPQTSIAEPAPEPQVALSTAGNSANDALCKEAWSFYEDATPATAAVGVLGCWMKSYSSDRDIGYCSYHGVSETVRVEASKAAIIEACFLRLNLTAAGQPTATTVTTTTTTVAPAVSTALLPRARWERIAVSGRAVRAEYQYSKVGRPVRYKCFVWDAEFEQFVRSGSVVKDSWSKLQGRHPDGAFSDQEGLAVALGVGCDGVVR